MIQDKNDCVFERDGKRFRFRAGAIIIEKDCILFWSNDNAAYLYTVGGGVHIGETAEEAVVREVKEETGVDYEIDRLVYIHQNFFRDPTVFDGEYHELAFYYLMKPRGTLELACEGVGEEHTVWLPLDKIKYFNVLPRFIKNIGSIPETPEFVITNELKI